MAKAKVAKVAKVEAPKVEAKAPVKKAAPIVVIDTSKPNGSPHRPYPWVEPFPVIEEGVYVRATVIQEIRIGGAGGINLKFPVGECTLPVEVAHAQAAALSAPKAKE
jgi:hypothetical protein